MTYHIEQIVDSFGKDKLLDLIFTEGIGQVEMHQVLGISKSTSRISAAVYKRIYNYIGIKELPYKLLRKEDKKFQLALDKYMPNYWESNYLVTELLDRLSNPSLNIAEDRFRCVISFPRHPKSNLTSKQIKAHIVAWELYNRQYVPDNHWVVPKDGDYLNLEEDNLVLVNTTEYKSNHFKGTGNPAYLHGKYAKPRLGGWSVISKNKILQDKACRICKSDNMLIVHHIISYHLFNKPLEANQDINLITLCRHCHGCVHGKSLSIKQVLISEMRYSKLIELLETLKSQVPDSLMETYRDVEKQLGLTDNQQPSTV